MEEHQGCTNERHGCSGDGSEARMEVKGMGERGEGDGGFLRNPRKKGG